MNINFEIFIYWLILVAIIACLFYSGTIKLEKLLKRIHISARMEGAIGALVALFFVTIIALLTWMVTFPTPLSVPTVRVTAQGNIIPLPYGAWIWQIPEGEKVVRLEETIDCDNFALQGRTEDGIPIEKWFGFEFLTFEITGYPAFYHHYKTAGFDGFCEDVKTIVYNETWIGKTILPNSQKNIESADQNLARLKRRFIDIFTRELADRGVVTIDNK